MKEKLEQSGWKFKYVSPDGYLIYGRGTMEIACDSIAEFAIFYRDLAYRGGRYPVIIDDEIFGLLTQVL